MIGDLGARDVRQRDRYQTAPVGDLGVVDPGARHVDRDLTGVGLLRADLDVEVTIDAIWGASYYCLVAHLPLTESYADALLAAFWPALAPPR